MEDAMRTWKVEVPPEPEGVTCVRDMDKDLWRKVGDGWRFVRSDGGLGQTPHSWDYLVTYYGPLVEVSES